jgi:glyoxylase-like metal-dependent hydrolase (beta-lactamase superfamily II)
MTNPSTFNNQVAIPTAFPASGSFGVTQRVTLLSDTPDALIHYTMDGSSPTAESPVFNPYVLPVLEATDDVAGGTTHYEIKSLALKDGLAASEMATFSYSIVRRAKGEYVFKELRPGLWMILDFDDTKMYLVVGSQRAMLIDAGLGAGDLRSLVQEKIGDLPLDVVITHAHPDHVAVMGQFQDHNDVYMNMIDLPLLKNFIERLHYEIDPTLVIDLREGVVFDLGDIKLRVYEVPGHSLGSVVLLDEATGLLIAGDAVGSNRPTITDSLWMQFPTMDKIDVYLSTLQVFREKVKGRLKVIYGGHNDEPIYGEAYLDNLQMAAQKLVDEGESALTPSLRPTDMWQTVVGDRLTDPNWAAINVSKDSCLTTPPDKIATLSNLQVNGGGLEPGFKLYNYNYEASVSAQATTATIKAIPSSGRYQSLTINGAPAKSGVAQTVTLASGGTTVEIKVSSPDGSATNTYTVKINKAVS